MRYWDLATLRQLRDARGFGRTAKDVSARA
jgi:hypothetical protein